MELPHRDCGDELLPAGELQQIRERLRRLAPLHDLATVIACAFDHRTRMLPFIFTDLRMVPAGVRAIGSDLVDSGFPKTRIVLQQWNRNFRPSQMQLDGRRPDLFLISSMGMHQAPARQMLRDICRLPADQRPLVIVGGSLCIYQPYEVFSATPSDPASADLAVTGEEYVFLNLLETLLTFRGRNEPLRAAFLRARDQGALDHIPGLVYPRGDGPALELIDTGIQRLVSDLDELPDPVLGYRLLETPSCHATLASQALSAQLVRKYSPISSLVMTFGCKFACPYCPIPAYNQRQHRIKSGQRIALEMSRLHQEYGLRHFFGTDDNFFNNKPRALGIVEALARAEVGGQPLRRKARWYTEVTVHDTLQMKDHLELVHDAGCRALWLGVEDMTATFIKKGQSVDKTSAAFRSLRAAGICPMPMLMHHDSQPLWTRNTPYGLLNQIRLLRQAGAVSLQVLMLTPSPGTKLYDSTFLSGQVFTSVGGREVQPYMHDGNFVIASKHPHPWRKQVNLLMAYCYFYNPLWLALALIHGRTRVNMKPAGMQLVGMCGLIPTIFRTIGWAFRLRFGRIKRETHPPASPLPLRNTQGGAALHELVVPLGRG